MHELTEAYLGLYPIEEKHIGPKSDRQNFKRWRTGDEEPYFRGQREVKTQKRFGVGGQNYSGDGTNFDAATTRKGKLRRIPQIQNNSVEYALDYLMNEGYATDYDSALNILEAMSDEWFESILSENVGGGHTTHSLTNQPITVGGRPVLKNSEKKDPNSPEETEKRTRRLKRGSNLNFEVR